MINPAADTAMYLADWAVPLTLSWRSVRKASRGVVSYDVEPVRFLSQGRAIPACVVAMSRDEALVLTPDWTIYIGTEARPVLEVVDDRSGLVNVYLGEPKPC